MSTTTTAATLSRATLEDWLEHAWLETQERVEATPAYRAVLAGYGHDVSANEEDRIAFEDNFEPGRLISEAIMAVAPSFIGPSTGLSSDKPYTYRCDVEALLAGVNLSSADFERVVPLERIEAFMRERNALLITISNALLKPPLKPVIEKELERVRTARARSKSKDVAAKRRRLERKLRELSDL